MQQTPQLLQSPPARPIAPVVRWIQTKAALRAHGGGQLDEFGIATGAEREELEAKREGKKRFDLDPPRGAFGTHVRFWILNIRRLSVKLLTCQAMLTASSTLSIISALYFSILHCGEGAILPKLMKNCNSVAAAFHFYLFTLEAVIEMLLSLWGFLFNCSMYRMPLQLWSHTMMYG
jgi:hypothetical protein